MNVQSAEVVVPCSSLDEAMAFYVDRLGMRLDAIHPADAPATAVVSGHGIRLRLDTTASGRGPGRLRLLVDTASATITAPDGTVIDLVAVESTLPDLVPQLVVALASVGEWGVGRAEMRYRDLIPGRLGGRFIASNIAIPHAGPVPDYVHHHRVRFQMIFVRRGWVRVVYEGQGEPFVMHEGDCVLQPPHIRHRVLENSDAFEVVEVSSPAAHETFIDHDMVLPSPPLPADHRWSGQRFVHHIAAEATWQRWGAAGFEYRDSGISDATDGLAAVRVIRPLDAASATVDHSHDGELWFAHVIRGSAMVEVDGRERHTLCDGDSVVIPAGVAITVSGATHDLELLEVSLPG
jgi:quercetin dioxygenase-like cupin family protein